MILGFLTDKYEDIVKARQMGFDSMPAGVRVKARRDARGASDGAISSFPDLSSPRG